MSPSDNSAPTQSGHAEVPMELGHATAELEQDKMDIKQHHESVNKHLTEPMVTSDIGADAADDLDSQKRKRSDLTDDAHDTEMTEGDEKMKRTRLQSPQDDTDLHMKIEGDTEVEGDDNDMNGGGDDSASELCTDDTEDPYCAIPDCTPEERIEELRKRVCRLRNQRDSAREYLAELSDQLLDANRHKTELAGILEQNQEDTFTMLKQLREPWVNFLQVYNDMRLPRDEQLHEASLEVLLRQVLHAKLEQITAKAAREDSGERAVPDNGNAIMLELPILQLAALRLGGKDEDEDEDEGELKDKGKGKTKDNDVEAEGSAKQEDL